MKPVTRYPGKLRLTITLPDCAPHVETWDHAHNDREIAERIAEVMRDGGATATLEVSCDKHGWHGAEDSYCDGCGLPECAALLCKNEDADGKLRCDDCVSTDEEDDECQCPAGAAFPYPCSCPACVRGPLSRDDPDHEADPYFDQRTAFDDW
jgi:hypothetical protein